MTKVQTGSIFKLTGIDRLCIVESTTSITGINFIVLYPISYSVYMAAESDFIILDEPCFNGESVMAESWNSIAVPESYLGQYVGCLSKKYNKYFSSFVYLKHQSRKNNILSVLTGPFLSANNDIRWLFRAQEFEELSSLRDQLVSTSNYLEKDN